jgi:hypothetical protein
MPHGSVQIHCIGQQIQFGKEVRHQPELALKLLEAELLLELARRLFQNCRCDLAKVGKHAITIQEDSGH